MVACLAPVPRDDIASFLGSVPVAVTVETHYVDSGLGSLTAEVIAEKGLRCKLIRAGVDSVPDRYSGSQQYMEHRFRLDAASLVESVLDARSLRRAPAGTIAGE
jgi:transketolase